MQKHLLNFFWQLFKNDYLRFLLVYFRYVFFRTTFAYREIDSSYSKPNTNHHNSAALKDMRTECFYNRIKYLHGILMSLEYIKKNSNILLIGSRTENELFYLKSYGFQNITCIDLLSYSPRIKCMDMHNLKFKRKTFDVIICGWVLIYSQNLKKCVNEIIKVSKNNAIIAIGYAKDKVRQKKNVNTAKQLLNLFGKKVKKNIFIYDGELSHLSKNNILNLAGHTSSNILTVFKLRK